MKCDNLIDTYNLKWNIDIEFTEIYRTSTSQHEANFAHFKEMLFASPLHLHWLWKWKIVNVHLNWWVLSNRKVSHCYDLTQSFMYYLKNSTCRVHIHSSTKMISNIPYSTKSDTQRTSKSYTSDWYILPFNTFSLEQFQYISPLCNWYMAERKYLF